MGQKVSEVGVSYDFIASEQFLRQKSLKNSSEVLSMAVWSEQVGPSLVHDSFLKGSVYCLQQPTIPVNITKKRCTSP